MYSTVLIKYQIIKTGNNNILIMLTQIKKIQKCLTQH